MIKISTEDKPFPTHRMSIFTLIMINVAAMISLSNITPVVGYGLSSVSYYLFAVLVFLLPVSFVSAELATGWPKHGGIYIWVKEALGAHWGFLAIFLQWIQIVFFYPSLLTFAATTFIYAYNPSLSDNRLFIYLFVIVFFWIATFLNFGGMKISGMMSTVGVILGTLIPGVLLIVLAVIFFGTGNTAAISLNLGAVIPNITGIDSIVFAIGIFLMFAGMEMSASHAEEVKNPQKNYPKAIFLTVIIAFFLVSLVTISIAIVVPESQLSISAGIMQAFQLFFDKFNLSWLINIIALGIIIGVFGTATTWIVGPTKGLLAVSRHGYLPPFFQKINKHHIPLTLLILQAIIVSIISLIIFFAPSVDSAFWMLQSLAIQSYLIMYILLFITGIKLRITEPKVHRDFRIPFGNKGMYFVAGVGLLASIFGLLVGFIPPSDIHVADPVAYAAFLFVIVLIVCAIPFSIYYLRRRSWDTDPEDQVVESPLKKLGTEE